jgi:hypothetical protein
MPLITIFPLIYWQIISVAYLEIGCYSFELNTITHFTGATLRFVIYFSLFLIFYSYTFNFLFNKYIPKVEIKKPVIINKNIFFIFFHFSILFVLLILLYYSPDQIPESPALFLSENKIYIRDFILKYLVIINFIVGILILHNQKNIFIFLTYVEEIILVFILSKFGHKFSYIIDVLFPFIFVLFILIINKFKEHKLIIKHVIGLFFLFIFSVIIIKQSFGNYIKLHVFAAKVFEQSSIHPEQTSTHPEQTSIHPEQSSIHPEQTSIHPEQSSTHPEQTSIHPEQSSTIKKYIKIRVLILQGGLFWITDKRIFVKKDKTNIKELIKYLKTTKDEQPLNLFITQKAIGEEKTKYLIEKKVRYTGSSPAIYYEIFGRYGPLLFFPIIGILLGISFFYCFYKILNGEFLLSILSFSIFVPIYNLTLNGDLTKFSVNFLIKLILVFLLEAYNIRLKKNNDEKIDNQKFFL